MQTVFTFRSVNTAARPSDKNDDVPRERRRRRPVPVGQKIIIHTATRRRRAALEVGNINNIFFFPTRYSIRVSFDFRALPTRRFGNELPPTPVVTAGDVSRVLRTPLLPAAARRFATDDDDTGDGTRQRLAPRLRPARRRVFAVTVAMLFLKIIAAIPCLVVLPVDATADPDVHPEHAELFSRDGRDGTAVTRREPNAVRPTNVIIKCCCRFAAMLGLRGRLRRSEAVHASRVPGPRHRLGAFQTGTGRLVLRSRRFRLRETAARRDHVHVRACE